MEPIAKIEYNGDVDALYYYYNDHLMTPLMMKDTSNTTVWQAPYYPFGNLYSETGSVTNNLRFPGQYDDRIPNASLFYNWNRFYSPIVGRYWSYDPKIEEGMSKNAYTYVDLNPIIFYDFCGLFKVHKSCCEKPFNKKVMKDIEDAASDVETTIRTSPCIKSDSLRNKMKAKMDDITIKCDETLPWCGSNKSFWFWSSKTITLGSYAMGGQCGPLASTILHETTHVAGKDDATSYACELSCYHYSDKNHPANAENCK